MAGSLWSGSHFCGPGLRGASHGAWCPWLVGCSPHSVCTAGLESGQIHPYPQFLLGKCLNSHVTFGAVQKRKSYSYMEHFLIIPGGSSQELIGKAVSLFVHQLKDNWHVQQTH